MTPAQALVSANPTSQRLMRRHYENFWVSSFLVPRRLRPHLARVYAYCRVTDDLGDERQDDAEAALLQWRDDVLRCFVDPPAPRDPTLLALSQTIARFRLPHQPFLDLIEANLRDQHVARYRTEDELIDYCRLSAAPVGRLVLRLYGVDNPELDRWSDDVCIGLQLANFAQDVTVDRDKGRIYLIQSDIERAGLVGAIATMCARATTLLHSGHRLEAAVPYRLAVQLSCYRLGGEAIIAAIARSGYRSDQVRPTVSNLEKAGLLLKGLVQSARRDANAQYRPAV